MFNRNVILFLLATALLGLAIDGGVYSVIVNLYLLRLEYGTEFIGTMNSVGMFTYALFCLPAGALGGWFGVRRMLVLGLVLVIAGAWMLPTATLLSAPYLGAWLLAAYVAIYCGLALYFVNGAPLLMDITQPHQHNRAFSTQSALLALMGFVGSMMGGLLPRVYAVASGTTLDDPAPYAFPLGVAAALMIPAVVAILAIDLSGPNGAGVQHHRAASQPAASLRNAGTGILVLLAATGVVRFFQVAGVGATATFFNVYMDTQFHVATASIGMIAAIGRLVAAGAALLTPVVAARWGAPRAVLFASTATALSMLPLIVASQWWFAGVGFLGVISFSAMRYPAYMAYTMELTPGPWRAAMSGVGEMSGGFCFALMALVGGFIIEGWGYTPFFLLGLGMAALGAVLFWALFMVPKRWRHAALMPVRP